MNLTPEQWLKRHGLFRCILIESDYIEAGQLKTLYLSNYPFRAKPTDTDANRTYLNWLNASSVLTFSQRMALALHGEVQVSTSAIEFFLYPKIEQLIINGDFAGQKLKVSIGAPSWPRDSFIEKFVGVGQNIQPVDINRARIPFSDLSESLTKSVLTNVISGGDNDGAFKPLCYGQCFNIEPVLIDKVTRTYQINDGPIEDVIAVRESGFLIDAVNYSVDKPNGTITINKNITGRLTLDCKGHVESSVYLTTAEQIINHLLSIEGHANAVDSGVLPSYTLGLYIKEQRNIDDCINEICTSVGASWHFDALSQFRLLHYTGIGSVSSSIKPSQIKKGSLRVKERLAAVSKLSLGYQKNYTPQADGLAAAITENNPELAELYKNEYSYVEGGNVVSNPSAAIERVTPTLIANKADAEIEKVRRLSLLSVPRTIFSLETHIKKHVLGSTLNLTHPRYFSAGQDVLLVGHIHRINNVTDVLEVLA